jgi:uncharacterized membrane protein YeaQ/YmgE (transglycosylase-associated protein family)
VLIIAIILLGLLAGAVGQWLTGNRRINWTIALLCGLLGSFVFGLLVSLISGDGIRLRPSGIIGSIVGAVVVTAGYQWISGRPAGRRR